MVVKVGRLEIKGGVGRAVVKDVVVGKSEINGGVGRAVQSLVEDIIGSGTSTRNMISERHSPAIISYVSPGSQFNFMGTYNRQR